MITIIGGGAIGLCSAYYLNKAGHEVLIIDNQPKNEENGCSFGNAGMIVPSHFIPLAAPGVIRQGIKWLLDKKSPLYIKPRLNKELLQWLWLFYKSANAKNVADSSKTLFDLNHTSKALYESISQEKGFSFNLEQKGLRMLYQTAKVQEEEEHLALLAKEMGIEATLLSKEEAQQQESDFNLNVCGAVHYHSDAHFHPGNFMKQMKHHLQSQGVHFSNNNTCTGFKTNGRQVFAISTTKGDFLTNKVILATGSWTPSIANMLNIKIPLQGGKGYSYTIQNTTKKLNIPSILCEKKIALTPFENAFRIAGTMEISGTDLSISNTRSSAITSGVNEYLTNFDSSQVKQQKPWVGLRPVTPDGLPFIGKINTMDNVFLNTGHAMMGMSLAPVSGLMISELISNNTSSFNHAILSPNRF